MEHKSEENAKDLIFHAGTVFDGIKRKNLTASRVIFRTVQKKPEGVTSKASRVTSVTACKSGQHDSVRCRSKQSEDYFGDEMTASPIWS